MITRRDDSLIGQIVAANVVLVALTLFGASLAAGLDLTSESQRWSFGILALSIVLTLCVNLWMLQRRFRPLERLIDRVERIDPAEPITHTLDEPEPVAEIDRLSASFRRLLDRIEEERRRSGTLVMRAQEEERRRLARDLHDEVNQALTAILLRLEALAQDSPPERAGEVSELKRLVNRAMEELLNLARHLRPSALDDHGLMPALETHLKRFSARTGIEVRLTHDGDPDQLPEDVQTALYRVTQEALANVGRHAGATVVEVEVEAGEERIELRVRDDGEGFRPRLGGARGLRPPRGRPRAQRHGRAGTPRRRRARRALGAGRRHERADADRPRPVIRVLIADDHGIVRSGLRMLIDRQTDMEVVAEADDGVAALEATQAHRPDVAVLDVSMPRLTGCRPRARSARTCRTRGCSCCRCTTTRATSSKGSRRAPPATC